jgi:hypothetical protein
MRRKCTIVEEDEEDEEGGTGEIITKKTVCDDSDVLGGRSGSRHSSTSSLADKSGYVDNQPGLNLDLGFMPGATATSKPLVAPVGSDSEATPAPFPVASQIGTGGLSRQGSLRKSGGETSGSSPASERKSGPGSPSTPPGSTPTSSQGSPARYKLSGSRKIVNTRSSPQLVLNQINEEAEEGRQTHNVIIIDPVDNFPQTSAGAVVIRRLEQRRKLRLHKARTTSCSSSDASDEEAAASEAGGRKRPQVPEKTPTPPPLGRDPHDDSSDSNQDPGGLGVSGIASTSSVVTITATKSGSNSGGGQQSGTKGGTVAHDDEGGRSTQHSCVTTSASSRHRNRHLNTSSRVRQSRSLNRISELHVVADFSTTASEVNNEGDYTSPASAASDCDMLCRYLESMNRAQTRSRDDSLNSSDGEFEAVQQPQQNRRHKVNLRVLEQRLNKIQEECNNAKNEAETDAAEDGDVSDNVSTVADDFSNNMKIIEIKAMLEDKENSFDDTTSVKSCCDGLYRRPRKKQPLLHRAHSCGSLFSLKERALLRRRLGSHLTSAVGAAFWDIISNTATTSEVVVEAAANKQPDLTMSLNTNPLAVFQIQSTSRCCSLC